MFSRSSRRLGWVGCHPRVSRVRALEAGWSIAKIGPNGPKFSCGTGWTGRASRAALAAYDQALRLYRAAGDRGNEAATLNNIGGVYGGLGEPQRALEYYGQALPITREVGDRAGEATTRHNIGAVHR